MQMTAQQNDRNWYKESTMEFMEFQQRGNETRNEWTVTLIAIIIHNL